MKTLGAFLIRIIVYLIVLAAGSYVMLFILEIVAIPIPQVQTYLACPKGTTIKYTWVQESWDHPGEKTMEKSCLDEGGIKQTAFSDEIYNQRQRELFLPVGFALMAVIEVVWLSIRAIKRKKRG
jgi:hypothetical protein